MEKKTSPYCQCLLFSASALARVVNRMAEEEFSPLGLAPSQGFILMSVVSNPGIQPGELGQQLELTPSTVTRLVERMEEKELVEKTSEGKHTYIYPTRKGIAMEKKVKAAWKNMFTRFVDKLGEEKTRDITRGITEAVEGLSS